ncbi:2,3-butanediol dehydrogenase [Gordonia rubripertincta]|uniref:2,3-butanediol dehydrogenase n=1 Tax=Gordonia rubripertincta TaxID=36822 RepID=A0ABT4MVK7_GORRU|nr:2,3-butanediol dehydrogenase [Gordonia rubripertincta]MCZ4551037.1 2,3-butanediol dehydrogenase [Gordonia rubripertincta]
MRAAMYYGNQKVEIVDAPNPAPAAGQVKVKVGFNGICGSDLHEYYAGPIFIPTEPHPLTGQQAPLILGHEFSGTISELGDGVDGFAIGDRVAVLPLYYCGKCSRCAAGNYNTCAQFAFHGLMADGGMAEYTVVPVGMLHKLPNDLPLELGALVEPMAVAYHAAQLGDLSPGDTAVVFGAGPIGIGLWFALRGIGIDDVVVVEPSADRRSAIRHLGAEVLDPSEADVISKILERTDGRGADAVFDAAGVPAAVATGLGCLAGRSPFVSVAIYEKPIETPLISLILGESRIQGSLGYTAPDFEAVINLMAKGHYDMTGWVTTVPIGDVVTEGFDALRDGRKIKVLVEPTA